MSCFYSVIGIATALLGSSAIHSMTHQPNAITFSDAKGRTLCHGTMEHLSYCSKLVGTQKDTIRLIGYVTLPAHINGPSFIEVLNEEITLQEEAAKGIPGIPYFYAFDKNVTMVNALLSKLNASYACGCEHVTTKVRQALKTVFPTRVCWNQMLTKYATKPGLAEKTVIESQCAHLTEAMEFSPTDEDEAASALKSFVTEFLIIDQQGNSEFCLISDLLASDNGELAKAFRKHFRTTELIDDSNNFFGIVIDNPKVSVSHLVQCLAIHKKAKDVLKQVAVSKHYVSSLELADAQAQALYTFAINTVIPTYITPPGATRDSVDQKIESLLYLAHYYTLPAAQSVLKYSKQYLN